MDRMSAPSEMSRVIARRQAVILLAVLLTACAAPQPSGSWDGLEYRAVAGFDAAYVRPGIELANYRSVLIDPVDVSFDKRWDPTGPSSEGMSPEAAQALQEGMAAELRRVLAVELVSGGYTMVDVPGADTLRLSASIVDLIVTPPGAMAPGKGHIYSLDAGRMTLVLELRDGPSGQLLARVVDQKAGTRTGRVDTPPSVSTSDAFGRVASDWARSLRAALDAVRAASS